MGFFVVFVCFLFLMTLGCLNNTKHFQNIAWPNCLLLENVYLSLEHLASVLTRFTYVLIETVFSVLAFLPPGNNILIVAHASSLEACTCQLQGLSPQNSKDFVQMVRKVIPACVSGACGALEFQNGSVLAESEVLWSWEGTFIGLFNRHVLNGALFKVLYQALGKRKRCV